MPFVSMYNYRNLDKIEKNSICFIRYNGIDLNGILYLRKLRKKNVRIYIEIPTYPYDNEMKKKKLFYKDKIMRNFLYRYVDKVFTYSNDKYIFRIPCINISNFVDCNKILPRANKSNNNEVNIIAVATLAFWHGYDRAIKGLHNYYLNTNNKVIVKLHFVGDGPILDDYKKMVKEYHLEKYVVFYGAKKGVELSNIYDICDIALDSLGRHRSGIFYNSSLKGKEYMAKGLPIISGVATELDSIDNYLYYLRVPADDSPLDINEICLFYEKVYGNQSKKEVIKSISSKAKEMFNIDIAMQPIIEELKSIDFNTK